MCVRICVRALSKTVDVSIPDAGGTMEPEQRDVSRGLSAPERSAAGLNASDGRRAPKVKDAAFKFILSCLLFFLDCWKHVNRQRRLNTL